MEAARCISRYIWEEMSFRSFVSSRRSFSSRSSGDSLNRQSSLPPWEGVGRDGDTEWGDYALPLGWGWLIDRTRFRLAPSYPVTSIATRAVVLARCEHVLSLTATFASQRSRAREARQGFESFASTAEQKPTKIFPQLRRTQHFKMFADCSWILFLGLLIAAAESLTSGLMDDVSKADQAMRPKAKRVQELLMFGNQQNRRAENAAAEAASNLYAANTEKRTLGTSGLEDVKAALAEGETFGHSKQQSNSMYDREELSPYEKNYEYGKILANDISPRNWDVPPYPRYYGIGDDRRKRSDKSAGAQVPSTTLTPSSSSALPTTQATPEPVAQAKRSIPVYQEPRYKRALDREEFLTLLSLWENSPARNRNWRNYGNDEYENVEDDAGVVGLDEEDPRGDGAWMAVEPPRHFSTSLHGQPMSSFDIGIPRTHPVNSYDQYESQYGMPYDGAQYGAAQYGALYPSQAYYPPEKRFVVARKRSQGYDSYAGRSDLASLSRLMGAQQQVYPNYPHRLVY